ncbi:MAG: peroxiredoxin [Rubrobacteraceae bacterium]|uniref:peroxiredoxin n=1 Tax=Rubrobacter naiadicus TaxID=1392641 RepID=UPI00235E5EA9|nr:peroxiredoxin [Rubrobacter naiadicus]MBX6764204.1 peroxiredoxin [Rubrobacteraceae bacterium]
MLQEGEQFPKLSFLTEDEKRISTEDLKGKTTVLYFYPKDATPGCTKEACAFRDRMQDYERAGVRVYGVSLDPPESHRRFREKNGLNFPLLTDEDGKAARSLGILSERGTAKRVTFVLDPEGRVSKVYPEVSPETHADEILQSL